MEKGAFGKEPALYALIPHPILDRFVATFEILNDPAIRLFWNGMLTSSPAGQGFAIAYYIFSRHDHIYTSTTPLQDNGHCNQTATKPFTSTIYHSHGARLSIFPLPLAISDRAYQWTLLGLFMITSMRA